MVKFLAVVLPQRHEPVHEGDEAFVVVALEQVDHFVDDDVLETVDGFFYELKI